MAGKRPELVQLYREICVWMLGERTSALAKEFGPFPHKFTACESGDVLESQEDNTVKIVTRKEVAAKICKLLEENLMEADGYNWTAKQADAFVDYWFYRAAPVPMPPSWNWAHEHELAFHKIFVPTAAPCPLWDEIMGRMDNAAAFKLWVGSLFFPKADRQTYVWLYGEGGDSKGAILRVLKRVFGPAFKSDNVPERPDKFWSYWLIGKRLVAFADTNNASFPASGFFKSLTGGDEVRCEIKGGASFGAQLQCMFIFASNARPALSSEKADIRRVILCEMQAIAVEPDPAYEEGLWDETPAFLASCLAAYGERGTFGPIRPDRETLDRWVAQLEDRHEAFLEEHFVLHDTLGSGRSPYILATDMTRYLHRTMKDPKIIGQFYDYIERKYRKKRHKIHVKPKAINGFDGLSFRIPHLVESCRNS